MMKRHPPRGQKICQRLKWPKETTDIPADRCKVDEFEIETKAEEINKKESML